MADPDPQVQTPGYWVQALRDYRTGGDGTAVAWETLNALAQQFETYSDAEDFRALPWPPEYDAYIETVAHEPYYPENPYIPLVRQPESLARLATSDDECVRAGVAAHPRTPRDVLATLAHDDESWVAETAIANPSLPVVLLAELALSDSAWTRRAVAGSERTPESVIDTLRRDPDAAVRRVAYTRAGTPLDLIETQDPRLLAPDSGLWDEMDFSAMSYGDCLRVVEIEPHSQGPCIERLSARLRELAGNDLLDEQQQVTAFLLTAKVADWPRHSRSIF